MSEGYVPMMRSHEADEIIRENPLAFVLMAVIAKRARYREGTDLRGLELGEAWIGDHSNCGMSMRQYRTAKQQLSKWNFATFKTTNKGTIARLTDSRVFDVLRWHDRQAERQVNDEPTTTNKKERRERLKDIGDHDAPHQVKSTAGAVPASEVGEEAWIDSLKSNPAYTGIDVAREHAKMVQWCEVSGKQPTRRRFINWLNRADKPMTCKSSGHDRNRNTANEGRADDYSGVGVINPEPAPATPAAPTGHTSQTETSAEPVNPPQAVDWSLAYKAIENGGPE